MQVLLKRANPMPTIPLTQTTMGIQWQGQAAIHLKTSKIHNSDNRYHQQQVNNSQQRTTTSPRPPKKWRRNKLKNSR